MASFFERAMQTPGEIAAEGSQTIPSGQRLRDIRDSIKRTNLGIKEWKANIKTVNE